MKKSLEFRFWKYVEKSDGCWIWKGTFQRSGYGVIGDGDGKMLRAHRVAWMLKNGPITDGLFVLHRCDNPACVRVDHLFLGTHTDNMRDKIVKGRSNPQKGTDRYNARFSEEAIRDIRKRASLGFSNKSIARLYRAAPSAIDRIVRGEAWKHVE